MSIISKIKKTLLATMVLGTLSTPFVIHDLANLGKKDAWTTFDKVRVKTYLESVGAIAYIVPPVGPLRGFHNVSVLGNAYIDKDLPNESQMNFLRDAVMYTPGDGNFDSFQQRFLDHETTAIERYNKTRKRTYVQEIVQPVSFNRYGLPFKDYFAITLRTDIVKGEPKSSFIVWGLGVIADHRNESSLGPQFDPIMKPLGLEGADLLSWINDLERFNVAKPYWVLITECEETSSFSYDAINLSSSERKRQWHQAVKERNKLGDGQSAGDLYGLFYLL